MKATEDKNAAIAQVGGGGWAGRAGVGGGVAAWLRVAQWCATDCGALRGALALSPAAPSHPAHSSAPPAPLAPG